MLADILQRELDSRSHDGTLRSLHRIPEGYVDFASNDYLGVIQSGALDTLVRENIKGTKKLSGAGGSRLISGDSAELQALESALAEFYQTEAALVFSSGYEANVGIISAIGSRKEIALLYDEHIHASMRDGCRLARCRSYHFRHNDLDDLEKKLKDCSGQPVILVESVYSMDGDCAPLEDLVSLAQKYGGEIIVDEAHSSGIYGENGEGLVIASGVKDRIFARVHTWGKAHGSQGAVIVMSEALRSYLVNFSRPFIYTTGVSSLLTLGAECSYLAIKGAGVARAALWENITIFQELAKNSSQDISQNNSPIQTFKSSHGGVVLHQLRDHLATHHLYCLPIFSPTVPNGQERLRISLHAFNSSEEIRTLFSALDNWERSL